MTLIVVLNEPQDLVNIAVVVRAMKNFGLRELRLVNPAEFDVGRIEGIAHKTGEVVQRAATFPTLDAALADCTYVYGLTARGRTAKRNMQWLPDAVAQIAAADQSDRIAMVFGREDKGLSNDDLDRCHRVVSIPTADDHSSMNLAQAVTVSLYAVHQATRPPGDFKRPRRDAPPATRAELEALFTDVEAALRAIEFFKSGNEPSIMRTVREVAHRTPIDGREAKLLRGMALEVVRFLERVGVR